MHHDTYACFRCDGQPTIYAVPQTVPVLDFIADHEEWHRHRDAYRGAMLAMSRFLVWVQLEAEIQIAMAGARRRGQYDRIDWADERGAVFIEWLRWDSRFLLTWPE